MYDVIVHFKRFNATGTVLSALNGQYCSNPKAYQINMPHAYIIMYNNILF